MCGKTQIGLLLCGVLWTSSTEAQESRVAVVEITYESARARARKRAPTVQVARARVREAESEEGAASVLRFNPQVSASAGPRFGADGTEVDWQVSAQQWIEAGGQRGDRVRAARAGSVASEARAADQERLVVRDVSLAFIAVLYLERRVALAEENIEVAASLARVAARRHELGDLGGLEESVTALSVARTESERGHAQATLIRAEGRLRTLLGLQPSARIVCRGDLRELAATTDADLMERPDLRALRADILRAEAEAELGRAHRVPNLAVGALYSHEESDDVVRGTLTVALPVFDHGQVETRVADASRDRLRAELDAAEISARTEVATARAVAERLRATARRFEEGGLRMLERAERLTTESYEVGAVPLGELLAVRRELLQAKVDYAHLLFEAANAHAELAASAGSLPRTSPNSNQGTP